MADKMTATDGSLNGMGRRPVALPALAVAALFAALLVATVYTYQRNEDKILEITRIVEMGPGRVSVLKGEIAQRIAWRPGYWATMAASLTGIVAALAYGTLRRR